MSTESIGSLIIDIAEFMLKEEFAPNAMPWLTRYWILVSGYWFLDTG